MLQGPALVPVPVPVLVLAALEMYTSYCAVQ